MLLVFVKCIILKLESSLTTFYCLDILLAIKYNLIDHQIIHRDIILNYTTTFAQVAEQKLLSQYDNYFFIYLHVFCWTICCIVKGSHSFLYIVYSVIQPWLFYKWNAQTRNRKVIMRIECFCQNCTYSIIFLAKRNLAQSLVQWRTGKFSKILGIAENREIQHTPWYSGEQGYFPFFPK